MTAALRSGLIFLASCAICGGLAGCTDWDALACDAGDLQSCAGGKGGGASGGVAGGTGGGLGGGASGGVAGGTSGGTGGGASGGVAGGTSGGTGGGVGGGTAGGSGGGSGGGVSGGTGGGSAGGVAGGMSGGSGGGGGSTDAGSLIVTAVFPAAVVSGQQVQVFFSNFVDAGITVTIGGAVCPGSFVIPASYACVVPPLAIGRYDVTVTDSAATATSPNALMELGSPVAWFDAADLMLPFGSGVSSWAEKSGHNATVSQPVVGLRPTSSTFRGLAAVRFDGSAGQYLENTSATAIVSGSSGRTVLIAGSLASIRDGVLLSVGSPSTSWRFVQATNERLRVGYPPLGGVLTTLDPVPANSPTLFETALANGADLTTTRIWLKGISVPALLDGDAGIPATSGAGLSVGGVPGFTMDGTIAEILVYDFELSGPERTAVETYLKTRYAL